MKTAITIIHIVAFSACFAVHAAGGGTLSGVRRAMQTLAGASAVITTGIEAPAV